MVDSKNNAQDLTVIHPTTAGYNATGDQYTYNSGDTWWPVWGDAQTGQNDTYISPYLLRFVKSNNNASILNANSTFFGTGIGSWTVFYAVDVEDFVNYPFTFSDAPSNGQFAENTHWYYLKLNDRYLSYNDETENYNYKGSNNKEQTFVYSYASNPLTYGCFWAFVKEGDDLKIYNAATGTSKVLSSNGSDERDFYPTMMTPGTEGYTDVWHYKDAQDITKFYLFLQGTKNKDEELYANDANKLNCYGTSGGGNPKEYLTFSTGAGAWSYFTVEEVDVQAVITSVKEQQKATTGAVGTLVETDYKNFTDEINKNTMEGLVNALKIRDLTGNTIPLISTQYYRLQNVYRTTDNGNTGRYMLGATADGLTSEKMDLTNASLLWKIEKTNEENESAVKLYHANAQKMSGAIPTNIGGKGVALSDDGAEYTMTKLGTAQYGFKIGSNYMVQFADNQIGSWNQASSNSDHAWYIMPATSIEVEVTSVGYATIKYPFAVQLPSEDYSIKAYTGTINDSKDELILNEVENRLIPANTPVVLVSTSAQSDQTSKTYTLNIVADDTTPSISENALSGSLLSTNITTEDYILSTFNDIVGFYKLEANGALAANKAYISGNTINPTSVQGVRGFTLSFDDNNGTTTNIEDSTIAPTEEAEEYYDLQGRRVLNPTKGIYVTKSGKKVLRLK